MSNQHNDANEGERRKREALTRLAARREVYVRRGRRALVARLLRQTTATADDVRADVFLPADLNPKLFGAIPGALAEAGLIRSNGYTTSTRAEAHARPIRLWMLANSADALAAWLDGNPDLPDAATGDQQRDLFDDHN